MKFVSYDDQSVGGRAQQLYTRLVNQDRAQFLFGPYSSGLTAPAAVISEQYGKIMVISGGAEEKPFQLGNKYLFMVISSATHYLSGAVEALKSKNPHAKIAIVYSDDPFSKTVLNAAKQQAEAAGLQVVMDESYAPSTTDFGPIVNKIISSNADAFLGGGHYSDGATLARQMFDQKANMKWVSILVAPGDDKFRTGGDGRDRAVAVGGPGFLQAARFGPTSEQFAKAFQAKYNAKADYHTASGYTSGVILQHAIEQANSIEPDKVAAALDPNRRHDFLRAYQVRHRSRTSWLADGARDGAGAVAKGERQARPSGGLAGCGEIRRSDLSVVGKPVSVSIAHRARFPSPLWGGARGGGRKARWLPSLTLPHKGGGKLIGLGRA